MAKKRAKPAAKPNANPWITMHGNRLVIDPSQDVYQAAIARIRHCFTLAPTVICSWSGGPASTTTLMLTLSVARELGRLPLTVAFIDEEIIDPSTIHHAEDIRHWDELKVDWFCVPIQHTLRSKERAHWQTWDPDQRAVWARDLPP